VRPALDPDGPLGRFAARVLTDELSELPVDRRRTTVAFVCRRAAQTPGPLRLGVTSLALGTAIAGRAVGDERVVSFMRATRLPLVGELARMVRSLAVAFIWETWPATSPTGADTTRDDTGDTANEASRDTSRDTGTDTTSEAGRDTTGERAAAT
jgi:hypothetical protein